MTSSLDDEHDQLYLEIQRELTFSCDSIGTFPDTHADMLSLMYQFRRERVSNVSIINRLTKRVTILKKETKPTMSHLVIIPTSCTSPSAPRECLTSKPSGRLDDPAETNGTV